MIRSPPNNNSNNDLLSRWSNIDHWRKLCPYLTISDNIAFDDGGNRNDDDMCGHAAEGKLLERLVDDGYALIDKGICGDELREKVVRGISEMEVGHSIPATFILLFDETWKLAARSHRLLLPNGDRNTRGGILRAAGGKDDMAFNFDVLAWHVDPRRDQSGFAPHRDRQPDTPEALEGSFYADGRAKYVTHWIALAEANPENSCLYVIPRGSDPGYSGGDDQAEGDDDGDGPGDGGRRPSDPLSRALPTKRSYQDIRALPRRAGQSVVFTHRILHWGSRGNPLSPGVRPRVAISFVYSDAALEAPYLSGRPLSEGPRDGEWNLPPFPTRLLLVCAQLLVYHQRFDLPASTLRACYDYCKAHASGLHDAYRKKVFVEYVKAMKESRDGIPDGETNRCDANNDNDEEKTDDVANSEDEEALLEEMLNHSGEFDDDYDDDVWNDNDKQTGNGKKRKCAG